MITAFRHFGLTVKNLDRSLEFYCKGFGFKLETQFERSQDYTEQVTGVSETSLKIALISQGAIVIELLEYVNRNDRAEKATSVHQTGAAHICLEVDSIQQTVANLVRQGAIFQEKITIVPFGVGENNQVIYGWDPDGIAFELVQVAKSSG